MNTFLWILQVLLALAFAAAGANKLLRTKEQLSEQMRWVDGFSQQTIRRIAVLELLGAAGLVLPAATGILPWLTPVAAVGLALDMVGAAATHARLKEWPLVGATTLLFALCVLVAWGRFGPYSI